MLPEKVEESLPTSNCLPPRGFCGKGLAGATGSPARPDRGAAAGTAAWMGRGETGSRRMGACCWVRHQHHLCARHS